MSQAGQSLVFDRFMWPMLAGRVVGEKALCDHTEWVSQPAVSVQTELPYAP